MVTTIALGIALFFGAMIVGSFAIAFAGAMFTWATTSAPSLAPQLRAQPRSVQREQLPPLDAAKPYGVK